MADTADETGPELISREEIWQAHVRAREAGGTYGDMIRRRDDGPDPLVPEPGPRG